MSVIEIYYLVINLITIALFFIDKRRAVKGRSDIRIPERRILLYSFMGGALGGFFAMILFRHKNRKLKFVTLLPIFMLFHIILIFKFNLF